MKFDCIEKPLRRLFRWYGGIVAKFPLVIMTIAILITCLLAGGLSYLEYNKDTLNLLAPEDGRWKVEKEIAHSLFEHQDDTNMLPNRMFESTRYGAVTITHTDSTQSLIEENAISEVLRFNDIVSNITVMGDNGEAVRFQDLCMSWQGRCIDNSILAFYDYDADEVSERQMTYPFASLANGFRLFNGGTLGGVTPPDKLGQIQDVEKAQAIRLFYFLRDDDNADDRQSASWEEEYKRIVTQFQSDTIQISWTTSQTLLQEVDNVVSEVFGLWWVGIVLVIFCIGAASTNNWVQSQPLLCLMGMVAAAMAILSAYGMMGFLQVPYNILSGSVPFLILGISLDDTFIIIGSWRQTSSQKSLEDRIKECLSESALSITITSLTDAVAFSIGIYSDFRAVQDFAKSCVTAIVLCYLFQLILFAPCLVFSGKRQMQNRHCFTFRKVKPKPKAKSSAYRIFCAGDSMSSEGVTGTPAMKFFRDYYGPFLNKTYVAIVVVIGYCAYLGTAMWGYTLLQEGFQERNWVLDDSHLVRYFDLQEQYYMHFGPEINVIATDETDYSDPDVQKSLEDTLNELEASQYTFESSVFTTSWLREYLRYLEGTGRSGNMSKPVFIDILRKEFLNHPFYQQYNLDIVFNDDNSSIVASKFLVYTKDMSNKRREADMMLEFRDIAKKCQVPLIVYHANFILYDQYIIMWPNTLHNLLVAGGAMFIIALFLIPHPVCAFIVTAAIASIIIGVLGFMSIWNIPLNHVSMVNLILCVGFSVDFSAHICYSFISAPAKNKRDRVRYALFYLGLPILQGGLSTILACVGTSTTDASSYRIFFKTMFLVITLGMLHGLVFLPVFLKIFIPIRTKSTEEKNEKEKEALKDQDKGTTEKFIVAPAVDAQEKKPCTFTKTMEGSVYQNGAQVITGQITWTDSKGEQMESKKWTVLQKGCS
ncbi:patched domain-containing protein 3-like [Amphiura filiformis]|uniref:patched domain-containing protein 3-like n=1 Tax=Amphiura filiformis TaxID=82378 RepID=UPI003B2130D8